MLRPLVRETHTCPLNLPLMGGPVGGVWTKTWCSFGNSPTCRRIQRPWEPFSTWTHLPLHPAPTIVAGPLLPSSQACHSCSVQHPGLLFRPGPQPTVGSSSRAIFEWGMPKACAPHLLGLDLNWSLGTVIQDIKGSASLFISTVVSYYLLMFPWPLVWGISFYLAS